MTRRPPRILELVVLDQVEDFFMPFDLTVDGFHEDWWANRVGRVGTGHYDWLSFVDQGEEVARAEIDYTATLGGDYTGPPIPRDVIDITFIEVRDERRRNGVGRAVMARIIERYPGRVLMRSPRRRTNSGRRSVGSAGPVWTAIPTIGRSSCGTGDWNPNPSPPQVSGACGVRRLVNNAPDGRLSHQMKSGDRAGRELEVLGPGSRHRS